MEPNARAITTQSTVATDHALKESSTEAAVARPAAAPKMRTLVDGSGAAVGGADYAAFGAYRNQTGVTSRFGFTGEYYAQETGMWHLRARDLHPGLGRFLSPDPVQPNAPGTQGYNLYAYVANNPTNWVDPSGYSLEEPVFNPDQAALAMIHAMGGGFVEILHCLNDAQCRGLKDTIDELGSQGANFVNWTAENLQQAFISTYPHVTRPVSPSVLVLSLALSNTLVFGDLYDLYIGVSGYDPITGQYLAGWERLANIAGAIPIFGVSGANIRHGLHSAESFIDEGDDIARFIGQTCSFDEATPVSTKDGPVAIGEIDVGDQVLAWDEATGATGYYTVTATMAHVDPVIVHLTINSETIETTPEHPFYEREAAPPALSLVEGWLVVGEAKGCWTPASELQAGDQIQQADGTTGVVQTVVFEATEPLMYNLTVADAHTYVVGDGQWVVQSVRLVASSKRDFCAILFS